MRVRGKECELEVMNSRLMKCMQGKFIGSVLGIERTQVAAQAGAKQARKETMVVVTHGGIQWSAHENLLQP